MGTHTLFQCPQGIGWLEAEPWRLSTIMESACAALLALQVIHFIPLLTETLLSSSSALRTARGLGHVGGGRGVVVVVWVLWVMGLQIHGDR